MSDPFVEAIRKRLNAIIDTPAGGILDALRAVLDLTPPEIEDGDDAEEYEGLTGAWYTCHSTVIRTIGEKLGVIQPSPIDRSVDALPDAMREML